VVEKKVKNQWSGVIGKIITSQ